jgi:hypothetical protein
MGDQPSDVPKDPSVDESDDDRPGESVSEGSDDVDLTEAHGHEGDGDIGLAAAYLEQGASIFQSLLVSFDTGT